MTGDPDARPEDGLSAFMELTALLEMPMSVEGAAADVDTLCTSVNAQRLANFPLELSPEDIRGMCKTIVLC